MRPTRIDIQSQNVNTYGTAGTQVKGRSTRCGESYARRFSKRPYQKQGNPAENHGHRYNPQN